MPVPAVLPLEGVLRRYAWGSPTAIPRLLGQQPDGRPAAELWFGAHEDDPSPALGSRLDTLIAQHPDRMLGAQTLDRFGARLPFLVKILAAGRALSIQVHPTRTRAEAGFAREQAAGIPRDAPERTYKDRNAKPELICALTPFEALCGFRPASETIAVLDELRMPQLAPLRELLQSEDPLRVAVTALLTNPDAGLADAVTRRLADVHCGPLRGAALAAADFPGDRGVVLALLLNYVSLEPGAAMFLDAGNLHAYLRGTGVEVMGNSDNVLRCGLTTKHVDITELLAIADFTTCQDPRLAPQAAPSGTTRYPVPVADFAVDRLAVRGGGAIAGGPAIVLCTAGHPSIAAAGASVQLSPGRAAFVVGEASRARTAGDGTVYLVRPGNS